MASTGQSVKSPLNDTSSECPQRHRWQKCCLVLGTPYACMPCASGPIQKVQSAGPHGRNVKSRPSVSLQACRAPPPNKEIHRMSFSSHLSPPPPLCPISCSLQFHLRAPRPFPVMAPMAEMFPTGVTQQQQTWRQQEYPRWWAPGAHKPYNGEMGCDSSLTSGRRAILQ